MDIKGMQEKLLASMPNARGDERREALHALLAKVVASLIARGTKDAAFIAAVVSGMGIAADMLLVNAGRMHRAPMPPAVVEELRAALDDGSGHHIMETVMARGAAVVLQAIRQLAAAGEAGVFAGGDPRMAGPAANDLPC